MLYIQVPIPPWLSCFELILILQWMIHKVHELISWIISWNIIENHYKNTTNNMKEDAASPYCTDHFSEATTLAKCKIR